MEVAIVARLAERFSYVYPLLHYRRFLLYKNRRLQKINGARNGSGTFKKCCVGHVNIKIFIYFNRLLVLCAWAFMHNGVSLFSVAAPAYFVHLGRKEGARGLPSRP